MEHHEHLEALYPEDSRFSEIEQLLGFIKEGNSCQMIGMPGVGRGNMCKFLAYNHQIRVKHLGETQTSYHFVFVNFAEVKNRPLFDVIKFLFLELVSSLHERLFEDAFMKTDRIFKDSLSYQDELVLFQGLKDAIDFLAHEKKLTIVLLLERFETYIPMLTDDFFIHLRSLRDHAKYKFAVVFSVVRPLEEVVEPSMLSDFYEFFVGRNVFLSVADMPGILFRINYLEKLTKKTVDPTLLQELLLLTAGHGKLTRLATESLLATTMTFSKKNVLEEYLLKEKTINQALGELWQFLMPSEQEVFEQLVKEQKGVIPEFLEHINLFSQQTCTIPLFQAYVAKQASIASSQKSTLSYDGITNDILKDGLSISEKLTSSEFRLLRFLIEHPEKVLDREELIGAVWKNSATTEGVTDQAVDQLIFRLRKKIEENPTSPSHIMTVKGRGLRFVP